MSRPLVGIFDSGLGGLSVAREIRRELPAEHLLYVADNAYLPYGDRPMEQIRARSLAIGRFLQDEGAKVLVVACNTASGAALEHLREVLSIPVIGLEPAVKPAVALTRTGRVGVMATSRTVGSERFARLVSTYANGVRVLPQACPGLADLVEDGQLHGPELEAALADFVEPLRREGADVVVLGCTHYPFVRDAIQAALGPGVTLIDSAPAIARRARSILTAAAALEPPGPGALRLLTTGDVAEVAPVAERLWGGPLPVEHVEV